MSEFKESIKTATELIGKPSEELFKKMAKEKGYKVKEASKQENIYDHFDFYIYNSISQFKVEVKGEKKGIKEGYVFVEILNVGGNIGWLYGKADIIAFNMGECFYLVNRKHLLSHIEQTVNYTDFVKDSNPEKMVGKVYRRENRADLITVININNIKNKEIWK